jgi:hypothetical protein
MAFQQSGLSEMIGEENIFATIDDALGRARELLEARAAEATTGSGNPGQ